MLVTACTDHTAWQRQLDQADSLMATDPDSAQALLSHMEKGLSDCRNLRVCMTHRLLTAKARNKNYSPLPSDSVFLEVVNYFDHHGCPNERILAHYLLGCIYRDQKEIPKAIECYKDALSCADTLSMDCDWLTLMSVYGQMENIYYHQNMPHHEIEALANYQHCAKKAGNLREYIRGRQLLVRPYYELDDTAGIERVTMEASNQYMLHGFKKEAASVFPTLIHIYLKQGKFPEARLLMNRFENESGLFVNGEIVPERSVYYNSKALYYEGIHQLDSAEWYYRKLKRYGYDVEAYSGLMSVYDQKGVIDSIVNYARLYEHAVDQKMSEIQTDVVAQVSAYYDYQHNQQIAREQMQRNSRLKRIIGLIVFLAIIAVASIIGFYRHSRMKREKQISKLQMEYEQSRAHSRNLDKEICALKTGKDALGEILENKKIENELLRNKVDSMAVQLQMLDAKKKEHLIYNTAIYQKFVKKSTNLSDHTPPVQRDWTALSDTVLFYIPPIGLFIQNEGSVLSPLERQVTLLVRLGFSNADISSIMQLSSQSVTNAKTNANKKLFHDAQAKTLYYHLKKIR